MLYYPQLLTGSVSQFPITRNNIRRTIVNTLDDGSSIRMGDPGAAAVGWDLTYADLTQDELNGIQQLFDAASGQWQTFTFIDPTDNLLNWSEDVSQAPWEVDPLIGVTGGGADPFGGTSAQTITNRSQADQQVWQILPIPGGYQYCFSVYIQSAQVSSIQLSANNGSGEVNAAYQAGLSWRRVMHSFKMPGLGETITVGLRIPAGVSISTFGFQLEAQIGAGGYKKTRDRAGVYPKARFGADTLQSIATGLKQYSCTVRISSNVAG